jgi:hypothetical protein
MVYFHQKIYKYKMMKQIGYLFIGLSLACGQSATPTTASQKTAPVANVPKEYTWTRPLEADEGNLMDLYGFIWFDTIAGELKKGTYTVFERPNCYTCKQVKIELPQNLVLVDLIDTNYVPDPVHAQWRLVKVTGQVNNRQLNTQKIERAVYSYPDYENSGYEKLTNEWIDLGVADMKYVYLDGVISPNGISFMDGYALFSIHSTGLKKPISIYIKKGNLHNQAQEVQAIQGPFIKMVLDSKGNMVGKQKVRLYGVWKNFIHTEDAPAAGMIFVESIQILQE